MSHASVQEWFDVGAIKRFDSTLSNGDLLLDALLQCIREERNRSATAEEWGLYLWRNESVMHPSVVSSLVKDQALRLHAVQYVTNRVAGLLLPNAPIAEHIDIATVTQNPNFWSWVREVMRTPTSDAARKVLNATADRLRRLVLERSDVFTVSDGKIKIDFMTPMLPPDIQRAPGFDDMIEALQLGIVTDANVAISLKPALQAMFSQNLVEFVGGKYIISPSAFTRAVDEIQDCEIGIESEEEDSINITGVKDEFGRLLNYLRRRDIAFSNMLYDENYKAFMDMRLHEDGELESMMGLLYVTPSANVRFDQGAMASKVNGLQAALDTANGPLHVKVNLSAPATIGLTGLLTLADFGLHHLMPRNWKSSFKHPPKPGKVGYFAGMWRYQKEYQVNWASVYVYLRAALAVNRKYAGRTIINEMPTLDKVTGILNWDVRHTPDAWVVEVAKGMKFDQHITSPSRSNPIYKGGSTYSFKRYGMYIEDASRALSALVAYPSVPTNLKTRLFIIIHSVLTAEVMGSFLAAADKACMLTGWGKHARMMVKNGTEIRVYDPWKSSVRIPDDAKIKAQSMGYTLKFIRREAEQFAGEGSCVFVAVMRLVSTAIHGFEVGMESPRVDHNIAIITYHVLSLYRSTPACKRRRL